MAEAFCTIRELAEHFRVSISTVRKWVKNDLIPRTAYIKVNETYRFDIKKAEAALLAAPSAEPTENANEQQTV